MAPELLQCKIESVGKNYTSKVDLWSIGIVFYFMLTGKYIFGKGSQYKVFAEIQRISLLIEKKTYFTQFSMPCNDLLRRLFVIDPKERISWSAFFSHSIFAKSYEQSEIRSEMFGINLIEGIGVNELFKKNSSIKLAPTSLDARAKKPDQSPFLSDIRESSRSKTFEVRSEIFKNVQVIGKEKSEAILLKQQQIKKMKCLFNHELNKYVYVVTVIKKIFPLLKNPKMAKLHMGLKELGYVLLLQKQERIKEIILGFENKANVLRIKKSSVNELFMKSKEGTLYRQYFSRLDNYFKILKGLLRAQIKESASHVPRVLPVDLNIAKGFKSLQQKIWILLFYSKAHKALMEDIILVRKFKLLMLEFLMIMKLSSNFRFMDSQTGGVFNWVKYYHELHSMEVGKIQLETLKLENEYFV